MVARRSIGDEEFQLLGIFADQAAMAIKSAQMYRELQRYRERLEVENAYLQEQIHEERGWEGIIGESVAIREVLRRVQQVAPVDTTVLLTRNHIRRALAATKGKVHGAGGAAGLLVINANTLRSRMRKLGIGKKQ